MVDCGLHFLRAEYEQAIQLYCKVLDINASLATSAGDEFESEVFMDRGRGSKRPIAMDKLQECHALFNLAQAASIAYDSEFRVAGTTSSTQPMSVIRARIDHLYSRVDSLKAAFVDKASRKQCLLGLKNGSNDGTKSIN